MCKSHLIFECIWASNSKRLCIGSSRQSLQILEYITRLCENSAQYRMPFKNLIVGYKNRMLEELETGSKPLYTLHIRAKGI